MVTLDNDILFKIIQIYINNIEKIHILDSDCLYKKIICKLLRCVNIDFKKYIDDNYYLNLESNYCNCSEDNYVVKNTKIKTCKYHGNKLIIYITKKIKQTINEMNPDVNNEFNIENNNIKNKNFNGSNNIVNLTNNYFIHFDWIYQNQKDFYYIRNILLDLFKVKILYKCCGGKGICIVKQ